jgi:hypothetical protein
MRVQASGSMSRWESLPVWTVCLRVSSTWERPNVFAVGLLQNQSIREGYTYTDTSILGLQEVGTTSYWFYELVYF